MWDLTRHPVPNPLSSWSHATLGGSWVVISGGIIRVTMVITPY